MRRVGRMHAGQKPSVQPRRSAALACAHIRSARETVVRPPPGISSARRAARSGEGPSQGVLRESPPRSTHTPSSPSFTPRLAAIGDVGRMRWRRGECGWEGEWVGQTVERGRASIKQRDWALGQAWPSRVSLTLVSAVGTHRDDFLCLRHNRWPCRAGDPALPPPWRASNHPPKLMYCLSDPPPT